VLGCQALWDERRGLRIDGLARQAKELHPVLAGQRLGHRLLAGIAVRDEERAQIMLRVRFQLVRKRVQLILGDNVRLDQELPDRAA